MNGSDPQLFELETTQRVHTCLHHIAILSFVERHIFHAKVTSVGLQNLVKIS